MGLISTKIFPACESMCVCCPALRSSSRQPVKRYKKLLAEIFPKSLIAKYLEERCYKELRVEHIKFINIVWERDNAQRMETEALEREREQIAKRRAEKYRVAARTAEERVHKFRIALIMSWVMIWLYFIVLA